MRTTLITVLVAVLTAAPALAIDPPPAGPTIGAARASLDQFVINETTRVDTLEKLILAPFVGYPKESQLKAMISLWGDVVTAHTDDKIAQRAAALDAYRVLKKRKDLVELPADYETWLDSDDAQWAWIGNRKDGGARLYRELKFLEGQTEINETFNKDLFEAQLEWLATRCKNAERTWAAAVKVQHSLPAFDTQVKLCNKSGREALGKISKNYKKFLERQDRFFEKVEKRSGNYANYFAAWKVPKGSRWFRLKLAWFGLHETRVGSFNESMDELIALHEKLEQKAFLAGCPMLKQLDLEDLSGSAQTKYIIPWQKDIILRKRARKK